MMRIPVFYSPRMNANSGSFSPSASKPAQVVEAWQRLNLPIDIIEPKAATRSEFKLVHDADYVDNVLSCRSKNGFGNQSPEVAQALPYTTGAMLSAAREAIRNKKVAVAPCSGFHHATYAVGGGFCTFNGLVVTAFVLKAEGLAKRVGILDFDMHYGDGTDELLRHWGADSWIKHFTAGEDYLYPNQALEFLVRIPGWVENMRDCDVILYQAGADPHINDPLGGFLTTEQLRARDSAVFEIASVLDIPIAWNLAGGYQIDGNGGIQAVLDIHNNTMLECATSYSAQRIK